MTIDRHQLPHLGVKLNSVRSSTKTRVDKSQNQSKRVEVHDQTFQPEQLQDEHRDHKKF